MKKLRLTAIIPGSLLLFCLFLNGCAGTHGIDWDKRVGNYSYDDMRSDFGEPWKTERAADGSKTCDWPVYIHQSWHTHADYLHADTGSDFQIPADRNPSSGGLNYYYRMTFNSKGILTKWQKVRV